MKDLDSHFLTLPQKDFWSRRLFVVILLTSYPVRVCLLRSLRNHCNLVPTLPVTRMSPWVLVKGNKWLKWNDLIFYVNSYPYNSRGSPVYNQESPTCFRIYNITEHRKGYRCHLFVYMSHRHLKFKVLTSFPTPPHVNPFFLQISRGNPLPTIPFFFPTPCHKVSLI